MDQLQIFNCEQGSIDWFAARRGILTASQFHILLQKSRSGGPSKERESYLNELAGEILTDEVAPGFSNEHTERGHVMEAEARNLYSMIRDVEPLQVGFLRRGGMGCSPDSLVGDDGMLEIKTKLPKLQIALLKSGVLPDEHKPQVQGQLLVSARQWCDFMSYWPGLPPFLVRVHRDETYIASLKVAAMDFLMDLDATVAFVRNYNPQQAAA
jgi:hypothetical protein